MELPIELARLPADGSSREVDFIAITGDSLSDEIEGMANRRESTLLGHNTSSQGQGHLGASSLATDAVADIWSQRWFWEGLVAIKYRCYLLDMDRIASMQVVQAEDDAAVLLEADRILAASPSTAVEIWDRSRKVAILGKRHTAA